MSWCREWGGGRPTHIYPIDDLRTHDIDGRNCWCAPRVEGEDDHPGDQIVIHNSADGREKFETGERKAS